MINKIIRNSYEAFIGLRYVRAKRRNHFISFISFSSIFGVTIGVTAVITVMAVMNGFDKELQDRILSMISHATVYDINENLSDWRNAIDEIEQHPEVIGAAPYFSAQAMLVNNKRVQGAVLRGVIPQEEVKVSEVANKMVKGDFDILAKGDFGIVLGTELARAIDVIVGDRINLIIPRASIVSEGTLPDMHIFNVVGIFEVGMRDYDGYLALIHLDDALNLLDLEGPTGMKIKTTDAMQANRIGKEIIQQNPGKYTVVDWSQEQSNFFRALKTEKIAMFVVLSLIVAVAAFNIISTLVMVVVDKQADIAVLRSMGASQGSIMKIFIIQGMVIGLIGMVVGDILGIWLANKIDVLVKYFEEIFNIEVLPCDIYYVCNLPSDLQTNDVIYISILAFMLCLLATVYPALRAARTRPAEALRYE